MRMKIKLALATILAALACAAPAGAEAVFEQPCARPFTDIYVSPFTGHAFIGQWTGIDVARSADPGDGVWRLYAVAVDDGTGWRLAYYEWRSCYL